MLKVNNRNTRTKIVNFEHILHLRSSVFIVNFEHVIAGCVMYFGFRKDNSRRRKKELLRKNFRPMEMVTHTDANLRYKNIHWKFVLIRSFLMHILSPENRENSVYY